MRFKRNNESLKHVREGKGFCHESTVKAHGKTYHVRFRDVHPEDPRNPPTPEQLELFAKRIIERQGEPFNPPRGE